MKREYYSDSISNFLRSSPEEILGKLAVNNDFALILTQRDAWVAEIVILHDILRTYEGSIYFEYSIPRMGRRIDVVLLIGPVIFANQWGHKSMGSDVRSNSNLASGLKSRPRNCPYTLVARRSGVRVIEGREFLTTKMQAVTQVNLDVAS